MVQTKYKLLLLIIIVKTTATITNGDGEECGSPVDSLCGYGSFCLRGTTCGCETGFSSRSTRLAPGARQKIYHCIEALRDNRCPIGTTCKDVRGNNYRCDCSESYVRSFLGQCISTSTELPTTTTIETLTANEQTKITDTLTTVSVVTNNNEIVTKGPSKSEDKPSTELVVSVVFNGILVAIVIIFVILFIRQHTRAKSSSNVLKVASGENNRDRDLTDIGVTSPGYQDSVSATNGIQSSNGNDTVMTQISDYVNTAVYDDMSPPVNSDYVNTSQPSQEYVSLRLGQPAEQALYEQLQNPGNV